MNNHKYMLEPMVYRCGPYCIRKFKGGWQWERSDKSVVDDHVYQTVYEAQAAIDKYECQLEHDNATEQGLYERVNRHQTASVPEQERYEPVDYVTSPPPTVKHDLADKMLMLNSKLAAMNQSKETTSALHMVSIILSQIIREKL